MFSQAVSSVVNRANAENNHKNIPAGASFYEWHFFLPRLSPFFVNEKQLETY